MAALKLIEATDPGSIFTYGDEENPDDRAAGDGVVNVWTLLWGFILRDCGLPETCNALIRQQIRYMLDAIDNQHEELFSDLPSWDSESIDYYEYAYYLLTIGVEVDRATLPLNWNVPIAELELKDNEPQAYIRLPLAVESTATSLQDWLIFHRSNAVEENPHSHVDVRVHSTKPRFTRTHAEDWPGLPPEENHYMSAKRNGVSSPGRVSPTVLSSVSCDTSDLDRISLETAETHLAGRLTNEFDDRPALLFVASNVKATGDGRLLRDPYAGMLPSFAIAGGCLDPQQRTIMVTWFPWQTPCLALRLSVVDGEYVPQVVDNKGTRSWLSITPSFTLFNNGLMVHLT